jgi:outer membrane protein insertion porin family
VTFHINEGRKLPVNEVLFRGNTLFSSDKLGSILKTRRWQRLIIGEQGGYLTDGQLRQDIERILGLYADKGYLHTRVTPYVAPSRALLANSAALAASIVAEVPSDGLVILFFIEEGEPTVIEQVTLDFNGPAHVAEKDLRRQLATKPGQPINTESARKDAETLRRYYFAHGFPRAEVKTEIRDGSSEQKKIVAYQITANEPAQVGKMALRGNYKTRSWVIRDEVGFKDGQPLTVGNAERAQANLRRSGLFSSVRLDYQGIEDPAQRNVNLLVTVQELHDNVGEVQTGFGFATDTRLFAEAGYRLQNIGGIGARFDLRGVLGQERQSIDGKLVLPHWIMRKTVGTPFMLELSSFYQVEETRRFGSLTSLGSSVAATKQGYYGFFEGWSLSLRYDFRRRNRDKDLVRTSGASDDIDQAKEVTISSTIGPQLVIDRRRDNEGRRNPLAPSRGFFFESRFEYGEDFLVGSNQFIKVGTSAQHFLKLTDHFLLTNAVRYDQGFPLGGDVLLPDVERFFAGGDTTVRGFEEDRLATEIREQMTPTLGNLMQFIVVPAGGNIRFIHNLELQIRVWRLKFPVASAIFLDTGLVTNSLDGFEFKDLRHSLGLALARIVLPFGSLSLEYAVPLDPQLGDNPQGRFHVNLGLLF